MKRIVKISKARYKELVRHNNVLTRLMNDYPEIREYVEKLKEQDRLKKATTTLSKIEEEEKYSQEIDIKKEKNSVDEKGKKINTPENEIKEETQKKEENSVNVINENEPKEENDSEKDAKEKCVKDQDEKKAQEIRANEADKKEIAK